MCDQISDAVLDAHLSQDPESKIACETATKSGLIIVFGEITSTAEVDIESVVRETVKKIGYDDESKGLPQKMILFFDSVFYDYLKKQFSKAISFRGYYHLFITFKDNIY